MLLLHFSLATLAEWRMPSVAIARSPAMCDFDAFLTSIRWRCPVWALPEREVDKALAGGTTDISKEFLCMS